MDYLSLFYYSKPDLSLWLPLPIRARPCVGVRSYLDLASIDYPCLLQVGLQLGQEGTLRALSRHQAANRKRFDRLEERFDRLKAVVRDSAGAAGPSGTQKHSLSDREQREQELGLPWDDHEAMEAVLSDREKFKLAVGYGVQYLRRDHFAADFCEKFISPRLQRRLFLGQKL